MYIYHFWPLCMHCQKTTTIRCFLEATYDLLVVLRKPWIYTLCFDAHFRKFRDFWWFLVIFNRKNEHFGPLLRVRWAVADIRPNKMALFDLVRNATNWCKYVQNLLPALLKLPCVHWGTKTTILHFWHPVFGPLFLTSRTKMLIYSALIEGPQNRAQKP